MDRNRTWKGRVEMAIRLERSGGLILIRGTRDEPEEPRKWIKYLQLGLWLALIMLASGVLFMGPHALLDWATVSHAFRSVLTAIW
jgi:hypothetical protein